MPEKTCERCHLPIRKGEGYAETDIGTGKWVHWPSCPPSARVFPETTEVKEERVPNRVEINAFVSKIKFNLGGRTIDVYGDQGQILWGILESGGIPSEPNMVEINEFVSEIEFDLERMTIDVYGKNGRILWGVAGSRVSPSSPSFSSSHHSSPERICERCGKPIKEGETSAETDIGSGKYTHWPSCPPEEHVPKIEEKPSPQGEATIVDGLTWKDYYSLRDLRLLLWGLEKELVGKYGIIEAEPLASKVRELIKKKIEQVTSKIGSTPEHHSSFHNKFASVRETIAIDQIAIHDEKTFLENIRDIAKKFDPNKSIIENLRQQGFIAMTFGTTLGNSDPTYLNWYLVIDKPNGIIEVIEREPLYSTSEHHSSGNPYPPASTGNPEKHIPDEELLKWLHAAKLVYREQKDFYRAGPLVTFEAFKKAYELALERGLMKQPFTVWFGSEPPKETKLPKLYEFISYTIRNVPWQILEKLAAELTIFPNIYTERFGNSLNVQLRNPNVAPSESRLKFFEIASKYKVEHMLRGEMEEQFWMD
jgi:hypothetical protein